jgi:hypothetical protein
MPTSSMFLLINRNLYILGPTRSRSLLATFGAQIMPSFSKVGLSILLVFHPSSDDLPDIYGRLRGEGIVKASLKGSSCGFCRRLLVSAVPTASGNRRELQPIITEGCSSMSWKCSIGCLPMHSSVVIGLRILRICTWQLAPDSHVCCDVITYSTAFVNTDIASGPLTTNDRTTRVLRGI